MKVLLFFLLIAPFSFGQIGMGTIKGTVNNKDGEFLPFVRVLVYASGDQNGSIKTRTETDFDGKFQLNALAPGMYDLVFTDFVSDFDTLRLEGVRVNPESITFLDRIEMSELEIIGCDFGLPVPITINPLDPFGRSTTIPKEDIRRH